jgi:ADP-ribose pyrophosphatase YjhB (NUDIX family)
MRTTERDIVSAVLLSRDGKALLCKKPDTKSTYAGKWVIPGGGVEAGETYRDALVREIREEVRLDIAALEHVLVDESGDSQERYMRETGETVWAVMKFYTYAVQLGLSASEARVVIDEEHVAHAWVPTNELHTYDMPEPSVRLFTKMGYM